MKQRWRRQAEGSRCLKDILSFGGHLALGLCMLLSSRELRNGQLYGRSRTPPFKEKTSVSSKEYSHGHLVLKLLLCPQILQRKKMSTADPSSEGNKDKLCVLGVSDSTGLGCTALPCRLTVLVLPHALSELVFSTRP